ncbi:DUF6428 family protein [Neolewinella persica]|uniref:DUF6428 family protein n=1 Tax=Neolewinella persica TaxID=70998 RepID=UPI00036847A1|nr:DUF6428 family protein [Neolewinella persica]
MTVSQIKANLSAHETLLFQLPDGTSVPAHFHVTEVGEVTKRFIDCGGTLRQERLVSLQLWSANDYNHRLHPGKLVSIIELAEKQLGLGDLEIEVEYQGPDTISKYSLDAGKNGTLLLASKHTDCLAKSDCGIPLPKQAVSLAGFVAKKTECTPGGGCC